MAKGDVHRRTDPDYEEACEVEARFRAHQFTQPIRPGAVGAESAENHEMVYNRIRDELLKKDEFTSTGS
jgi:hypothetical protein